MVVLLKREKNIIPYWRTSIGWHGESARLSERETTGAIGLRSWTYRTEQTEMA